MQSICNYLADPNGEIEIFNNGQGCNSQEEVLDSCNIISVDESKYLSTFNLYPNPCSGNSKLRFVNNKDGLVICDLFEVSGIKIKQIMNEVKMPGTFEMEIILNDVQPGLYFIVLKTSDGNHIQKLIKK